MEIDDEALGVKICDIDQFLNLAIQTENKIKRKANKEASWNNIKAKLGIKSTSKPTIFKQKKKEQ
jgi:hypothetical protein